jgi:hypothetical protein
MSLMDAYCAWRMVPDLDRATRGIVHGAVKGAGRAWIRPRLCRAGPLSLANPNAKCIG